MVKSCLDLNVFRAFHVGVRNLSDWWQTDRIGACIMSAPHRQCFAGVRANQKQYRRVAIE